MLWGRLRPMVSATIKQSIAPLTTRAESLTSPLLQQQAPLPPTVAATASTSTTTSAIAQSPLDHGHPKVTGEAPATSTIRAKGTNPAALRDPIAAHRLQLKADLKVALDTLQKLPPALTFFGGARIKESDPYYKISQEIGRLLAERGVPPRTGAGPGIMQSVPEGYVTHRKELEARGHKPGPSQQLRHIDGLGAEASLDDVRTQGFNIKLPHEQKLNAVIEVAREIQLFPFRKLALYENARGVVTFPGGFGTLDELFEIWTLSAKGKLSDPLAAVGVDFWQPTLDALHKVAVDDRQLISPADFARLFVTDDPVALLDHMLAPASPDGSPGETPRGFEQDPVTLGRTLLKEIDVATKGMKTLKPAVAFLGGETLADSDPALAVVRGLARHVAEQGVAVRVGDGGSGSRAVVDAARDAGADNKSIQAIEWSASPTASLSSSTGAGALKPAATFSERIPHKELLLRSAEAYVVLPAGLKGLDEMATVLCQMQTGKLPKRPLVLVGSDYWKPILDAWQTTMLSPERKLIAPEDMELFTVVDTVAEAERALTNLR